MGFFEQLARDFQFNIIDGDRYLMLVRGLGTTVLIALCAAIIGIVLGSVIALMRLSTWRVGKTFYPLRAISSFYVDVIRGTPMVVQLMIMYYVILASSSLSKELIAIISFGLNSAAYTSEIVRGGILAVDKGQTRPGARWGCPRRRP